MRILAISDSHRNTDALETVLRSQPQAEHVFFLGDCTGDIEPLIPLFPDKRFHIVSGNCDLFSTFPSSGIETVAGVKIFYTHGHTLGVKHGIDHLMKTARNNGCRLALYGHTHVPQTVYEDGLYVVNPGSCSESRNGRESYAAIDLTEDGIMPLLIEL